MEYRVEIYFIEKGKLQAEIIYEGEDINEGIHQETLVRERLGDSFIHSKWYGKDKDCKVRKNTWIELLW